MARSLRIHNSDRLPLAIASLFFLQNLDGSILNTSFPQLAQSFGVTAVDINLGITSYFIATAALVPLSGWFAKRLGERRTLTGALLLFIVASMLCALSQTLQQFVAARILQGMGAALMTPVGRIAVLKNAGKGDLLRAISVLTWPALLSPVAGPWLGGVLTTWAGWQANFLVNLPLGLACLLLVRAIVPTGEVDPDARLDMVGAVLISVALGSLIFGLDQFGHSTPRHLVLGGGLVAGAAVFGWTALAWLRRARSPLIDPAVMTIRTFAFSTYGGANLVRAAIAATPYLLPLLVQIGWGMGPVEAGTVMLVYFLGNLLMKTSTTAVIRRLGFPLSLLTSGTTVAISIIALPLLGWDRLTIVNGTVLLLAGASRSLFFTASNTLSFSDVPPRLTASASAFASMMLEVSMAVGVALAAASLSLLNGHGTGGALERADFLAGFTAIGVLAILGTSLTLRLPKSAGEDVRYPKTT